VYYLILLFGFQGKYQVRGGEMALADVTDRVAEALRRAGTLKEVTLSPHGARPRETGSAVRRNLPLLAISVAALTFALVVFVVLHLTLTSSTDDVVDEIEQSTSSIQAR
jgi:type VI secretion system protein ImpK